ncbi:MAG: hypothetical protein KatS3mg025_1616 [Bacteroidia bacterium]|nr:MAG: hypothetical protein KatS3mg025_1616 [Bacteroidia bacterium]
MRTRKAFLGIGLLLSSAPLWAQNVGIGTAMPHPAARLHVAGTDMGVLLPTAALTSATVWTPLVGTPQAGMIVYNTATAGTPPNDVSPGYYYWDGSRWVRMDGGTKAWLLTGNAGTNPTVNFLGTTDAQPLVIRVNNQETFRFNTPGTVAPGWSIQRGGGNTRGLHAVDLQSSRSANTQVASGAYSVISGGRDNTASSGYSTVSGGYQNTATGNFSTVAGGYQNQASGSYALAAGYQNVASGSMSTALGDRDTVLGSGSMAVGSVHRVEPLVAAAIGGVNNKILGSGAEQVIIGGQGNTIMNSGGSVIVGSDRSVIMSGESWKGIYSCSQCSIGTAITGGGWQSIIVGGAHNAIRTNGANSAGGACAIIASGNSVVAPNGEAVWGATIISSGRDTVISGKSYAGYRSKYHGAVFGLGCAYCDLRGYYVYGIGYGVRPTADPNTHADRLYIFGNGNTIPGYLTIPTEEPPGNQPVVSRPGRVAINRWTEPQYPLQVGESGNTSTGNGAYVSGGGTWTNGSSISFKERFVDLDKQDILSRVCRLTIKGWYYKGTEEYHIGPFAEEFYSLFRTGAQDAPDVEKYISTVDPAGVALVSIQALVERLESQARRISQLEEQLRTLSERVADLEAQNRQLRSQGQ